MSGFDPNQKRDLAGRWTALAGLMKANGGFTQTMAGETNPPKGYSVGIGSPDGKDWRRLPHGSTTAADIESFARDHADELAKPNRGIGGWSNSDPADGEVRDALDVVEVYKDRKQAMAAARRAKQDAIFDLESFETLPVKKKKPKIDLSWDTITPTLHTSADIELAAEGGKVAFWKQILPLAEIKYTAKGGERRSLDFSKQYLSDLATSKAVDAIPFLLADRDNAHTMDPERYRGNVVKMEIREGNPDPKHDGLWGKIVFPTLAAAEAVLSNPDLGVSARIREGVQRSDGSTVSRGIIHVLGTLDPQVSGMSPWQSTDLSKDQAEVLDLSTEEYTDMATKTADKALTDYTEADIDAMTEAELDTFLAKFAAVGDTPAELDEAEEVEEGEEADEKVAAELSTEGKDDIELANQRAETAGRKATEALRRLAETEWKAEKAGLLSAGVPPFALDLATPILNRPEDLVIDLSNTGEKDLDVSKVIRGLLDALKGTVDLSNEEGHNGQFSEGDGTDPDKAVLDAWDTQF